MTDTAPESLLDWMTGLVADPAAAARFTADPRAGLAAQGLADLDPADLAHAMPLVTDSVAARFDTTVAATTPPAVLAGEGALEALARHVGSVPALVGAGVDAPDPDGPDDWTESLVDDPAGAPDDLDGVTPDHDLDVMTRPDVADDLDDTPAAAPALALVPSAPPDEPGPDDGPGELAGWTGAEDHDVDDPGTDGSGLHEPQDHHPDDEHDLNDEHDLDVAP